jgi:hypothetical protein
MIRTWKWLGLQAVLCAALTAAPTFAGPIENPGPDGDKAPDTISRQLAELQKTLNAIQEQLKALEARRVDSDLRVQSLTQRVDALERKVGITPPSTSLYPPGATGTVQLVNDYSTPIDFLIGSTLYRLRPGERRDLTLPLGTFSFRILDVAGYQNQQMRLLTGDRPYVIRVH